MRLWPPTCATPEFGDQDVRQNDHVKFIAKGRGLKRHSLKFVVNYRSTRSCRKMIEFLEEASAAVG